jgi:hypothetical protein
VTVICECIRFRALVKPRKADLVVLVQILEETFLLAGVNVDEVCRDE